jgi:plasmid rolling circle replication initiator protein Rep
MKNHLPVNRDDSTKSDNSQYLSILSPSHESWDIHRAEAEDVEATYRAIRWPAFQKLATRIKNCSGYLGFALIPDEDGKEKLKLTRVYFCRVRYCPVCQWRRQMVLKVRFAEALEHVYEHTPEVRWVFLTLTVKNVPVSSLRAEIQSMNAGWARMLRRKELKAASILGWAKAIEVTRGEDGNAHPHFHVLFMVKPSYFKKYYISQRKWTQMWQECMKLDYTPIVHVQAVKTNERKAIAELLKYSVKPSDLVEDAEWLMDLTTQTQNLRFISFGGELRKSFKFLRDFEKHLATSDEMTFVEETYEDGIDMSMKGMEPEVWFSWSRKARKYVLY